MAQIEPEAVEEKRPIEVVPGLELGDDGVVRVGQRIATVDDVPERRDLPAGHPLYGQRVVRVVPSGMPDCTIDENGRLVPVDAKPEPEPEPIEVIR